MVYTKTIGPHTTAVMFFALFVVLSILLFSCPVEAEGEWITRTSFKDVRRMAVIDGSLCAATSGGLLVIDNPDEPGRAFLNTDGLGTTDIYDVLLDDSGQVWLAAFGRLIKFESDSPQQFPFLPSEGDLFALTALEDDGDNLWVGTDSGLVLFSKINDGGQIEGHFPLTTVNSFPSVYNIAVDGNLIWVATSFGLVMADKSNSGSLFPPSAWTQFNYTDYPELGSDTITAVATFESKIYVGTSHGIFRLDINGEDTTFSACPIAIEQRVYDIVVENDSMFVYYSFGIGVFTDSGIDTLATDGLPSPPITGTNWQGERWVGVTDGGIYTNRSGTFVEYLYTGLPDNDITKVTIDGSGYIVAGFGLDLYARYDGESWKNTGTDVHSGTLCLVTDATGAVWAGTWGQGLWRIDGDSAKKYDDNNSTCVGIPNAHNYVVTKGIATDGKRIYASCYLAYNNAPVAVCPLNQLDDPSAWDSIGISEGLTDHLVTGLGCKPKQLAVGTEGSGVFLCDLTDELDGSVNASCTQYTRENSPLISNTINVISYSPHGNAWVGTNFGLSRWDPGIERFVDVVLPLGIGPDITAISFDGLGNLWIGTSSGLVYRDAVTGFVTAYTSNNCDLVSDEISGLFLNGATGDLYVATDAGLSILKSQIKYRTTVLDSVTAVPNPFVIHSDNDRMGFNYNRPGTARIYTIAGESVIEFPVNNSWDGRNSHNRKVASGVYIFVITDEEGNMARGKVLVVRY